MLSAVDSGMTPGDAEVDWSVYRSQEDFEVAWVESGVRQYASILGTQSEYDRFDWSRWYELNRCDDCSTIRHVYGAPFSVAMEDRSLGAPQFTATNLSVAMNSTGASIDSTNVQVAGVDEADFIKADGHHLFVTRDGAVTTLEAGTDGSVTIVSRTELPGSLVAQYLIGDRLVVIAQHESWSQFNGGYRSQVTVTVFNVSNPAQSWIAEETRLDGRYTNSRAVGQDVFLVVTNAFQQSPPPPPPLSNCQEEPVSEPGFIVAHVTCTYETRDDYVARIDPSFTLDLPGIYLPDGSDSGAWQRVAPLTPLTTIHKPVTDVYSTLVTLVDLNVADDSSLPVDTTSILTSGVSQIYATPHSLYVMAPEGWPWSSTSTQIFRASLVSGEVEFTGHGRVTGGLNNQFSVDEFGGYLRVATTSGWWSGDWTNRMFVLDTEGSTLDIVGRLEGIAPHERIYSVRYLGDRAYVVTFQQVDPLFVIDLSDPTSPRILGELKVPGFSRYLHPIDDHHVIGIGRNADPTGFGFAWYRGLQASLFDVSDPANPILVDRYDVPYTDYFDSRNQHSDAEYDHHAVSYFAQSGILTLPVTRALTWWAPSDNLPAFELLVLKVDPQSGFQLLAGIAHDSPVRRSLRIGDRLYSVSDTTIKVHDLHDPTRQLGVARSGDGTMPIQSLDALRRASPSIQASVRLARQRRDLEAHEAPEVFASRFGNFSERQDETNRLPETSLASRLMSTVGSAISPLPDWLSTPQVSTVMPRDGWSGFTAIRIASPDTTTLDWFWEQLGSDLDDLTSPLDELFDQSAVEPDDHLSQPLSRPSSEPAESPDLDPGESHA
jgi:uncharacterized secreted protein with C-terminal beta-propeller domain